MNSFKSGSGNFNFGADDSSEVTTSDEQSSSHTEHSSEQTSSPEYPYFVRRSNVGDERDNRLEIHVRDKVTDREAEFRTELAERLGVDEIPKTDARGFALLAAYNNPEQVAERIREEGFGVLD